MDLTPFKQDVDELINEFDKGNFKSFYEWKRVWLARKFSYIFDAKPGGSNMAIFMQSLYDHCFGHMAATYSLSHRLAGLYCLYCFYEIQPFRPQFKIYLFQGDVRRLNDLVVDATKKGNRILSLVMKMHEMKAFVFGLVNMNDCSTEETRKINMHKAILESMHKNLFPDDSLDQFLYMDMGVELGLGEIQKVTADYAEAKARLLKETSGLSNMEDIKHILENRSLIGDELGVIAKKWDMEKEKFCRETGSKRAALFQRNDSSEQISFAQPSVESQLGDDSFPPNGFMKLLTAEDKEEEGSQDLTEELQRLLGIEENQEEDSAYVDDLEKQLSWSTSEDSS